MVSMNHSIAVFPLTCSFLLWAFQATSSAATAETRLTFRAASGEASAGDSALVAGVAVTPPVLDGVLGENEWTIAGRSRFVSGSDAPETFVYALHDDENLYFAFDCREPHPKKMRALYSPNGVGKFGPSPDGDVDSYYDDAVKIFIFPEHPDRKLQFIANPIGGHYDGVVENGKDDPGWKGDWDSAARIYPDRWIIEFRMARMSVLAEGKLARACRAAFLRNRFAGGAGEHLYWQPDGMSTWQGARTLAFNADPTVAVRDVSVGRMRVGANLWRATFLNLGSAPRRLTLRAEPGSRQADLHLDANTSDTAGVAIVAPHAKTSMTYQVDIESEDGAPIVRLWQEGHEIAAPLFAWIEKFRYEPADRAASVFFDLEVAEETLSKGKVQARWVETESEAIAEATPTGRRGELTVALRDLPAGKRALELSLLDENGEIVHKTSPLRFEIAPPPSAPASDGRIPIQIGIPQTARNASGLYPITMGVPFPKGALSEPNQVALLDESKNAAPLQTRVAQWWGRNQSSVQWLHLDFQVPAGANGQT